MKIIYWILGTIIFLFILRTLIILGLKFGARYFLKKYVGDKALARQSDTIHLVKDESRRWQNAEAMEANSRKLLAKGFSDVGIFRINELPDVTLRLFIKSEEYVASTIYEHPKVGLWMDCYTRYQDGKGITFSTSKDPGLDQRPGHPIIYLPGLASDDLYERAIKERPKDSMVHLTADSLQKYFEQAYAEGMVWRKNKGISGKEVAKVAVARNLTGNKG